MKLLAIAALLGLTASCSTAKKSPDNTGDILQPIKYESVSALAIELGEPGKLVFAKQLSCGRQTLKSPGFVFPSFTLRWSRNVPLQVESVTANVSDAKGHAAKLELPVKEIELLLAREDGTLTEAAVIRTPCALAFGGINWLKKNEPLSVEIVVRGRTLDAQGEIADIDANLKTLIPAQK